MIPETKKLYWLVQDDDGPGSVIGFVANEDQGGLVIGGPTGTHCTGHGEGWRSKWAELLAAGFHEIVRPNWTPPRLSRNERILLKQYTEREET
jgi:hypothetical protein